MPPSTWRNHHQTITNTFMDYCNNVDYHSHQIVGHRTKLHHQILAAQMLHHPHHDLVLHHVAHCILHRDIDVGHWHNAWCTNFMVKWVSAVATLGNSSILKRDRIIHGSLSIWLNIIFLIIQTSRPSIKCGGIPALTNMNLGLRLTGGFNIALQIPSGRDQSGSWCAAHIRKWQILSNVISSLCFVTHDVSSLCLPNPKLSTLRKF